jgi:hypothetical protein
VTVLFSPLVGGAQTATLNIVSNAAQSPLSVALSGNLAQEAYFPLHGIEFGANPVGQGTLAQVLVVLSEGGDNPLFFPPGSFTVSGPNASAFTVSVPSQGGCSGWVMTSICIVQIVMEPESAGAQSAQLTMTAPWMLPTDPAASVPLTGTGVVGPLATSVACIPLASRLLFNCPELPILGEPPDNSVAYHWTSPVNIPGYVDPSMRKDPNSPVTFLAYSSLAYTSSAGLPDNTPVINLHLSHRADGESSFQYDGPILTAKPITQSQSTAYSNSNYSSYGTIDLLPIAQSGGATWVQAHQSLLVASGGSLSGQLTATSYISISAVYVPISDATTEAAALVKIGSVPEARLGTSFADSTIQLTQILTSLSSSAAQCTVLQQPALWYQDTKLFLGLQCLEPAASQDSHQMNYLIYSTTPTGTDATTWTWSYIGEMATASAASALSASESLNYTYFTGAEFTKTEAGDLAMLMSTTSTADGTSGQGCRLIPVTSLTAPSLAQDASTGTVAVAGRVDGSGGWLGGGTCTYAPSSNTGIVSARLVVDRFTSCCANLGYTLFQSLIVP